MNSASWNFSSQSNSGNSNNNMFGQDSQKPGPKPFGSNDTVPASSSSNIFSSPTAISGSGPPSLFGTSSNTNQGSSIFGGGGSTGGTGFFGSNQPASSGTTFGQTQQPMSPAANQPSKSLGGNAIGGGIFSSLGESTPKAAPMGASTPTSKASAPFTFGNTSTTPAGPPPSNSLAFGIDSITQQPHSLAPSSANTAAPSSSSGGSSLFGNGASKSAANIFSSSQATESKNLPAFPQNTTSIFSQPSGNTNSSLFGNKNEVAAGLFSNPKPNESKSVLTSTPQTETAKPFFQNTGGQSAAPTASEQKSASSLFSKPPSSDGPTESKPSFNFPSLTPKPAESGSSTTKTNNMFDIGGQTTSASTVAPLSTPTATSAASTTNLFPNMGKPTEKPTAPASAASGPSFGGAVSSSIPSSFLPAPSASADKSSVAKNADPASATAGKLTLGASTSGPTPAAQSRLKNKSMDEIITRWASDLSKYQKEFQRQAEAVAAWDRMLVENSDKIQKLYGSTLEAQRATSEVERQLTLVENEQADLERDLDAYERQVDEMTAVQQGLGDSLQGPDAERQRMYDLTESVNGRLDEMGKDLGTMIEEINDASLRLNKGNKTDDPLSQVVRVLNSHLTQLQQIDQGAAALQLKVSAAQKASLGTASATGYVGPASDAADGFYRSFMGRR
ncbi:MAG: FG-nucleoporin nsp1 [Heterodermia speciosa]|uniref:Nucleoporin NSP1 n=1 Tax=Heterodermia speciosa TaxID=116794 RepID=A0A8H3ETL1_9LECA|nr:MAG: FG-nucleoporin nsp1 [Heterodermia speciosa]